ncbi:MAG TPA: hypothetical protein VNP03_06170 [Pseudonocardia sp.]|nr:hypothetical protein [Pseudonocardia sp.]
MISTVVWGTGNVGRAAIRAVEAHPALQLAAVLVHNPGKVGRDAGEGAHRVIIEGRPPIEVTVEATDEGENRSAGGNAIAVGRLVGAVDWLAHAEPGLYDAPGVPLRPAVGTLGRKQP